MFCLGGKTRLPATGSPAKEALTTKKYLVLLSRRPRGSREVAGGSWLFPTPRRRPLVASPLQQNTVGAPGRGGGGQEVAKQHGSRGAPPGDRHDITRKESRGPVSTGREEATRLFPVSTIHRVIDFFSPNSGGRMCVL